MAAPPSDDEQCLAEVGMKILTDDDAPRARAECMRIARRLHAAGERIIGLIPATDRVGVPPLALQIGAALTDLTGATVAFVDANIRYPSMAPITSGLPEQTEAGSAFSTRWIRGSLAVLAPHGSVRAGEAVPQLARLLVSGVDLFQYVLVDLTGFDRLGEHGSAAACMDAVILIGQAHRTRERDLLRFQAEMPDKRFLGVLLVG